jgi:hypothetical protein
MKDYQVQVRMSYYVWVDVQADNKEFAEAQALRMAWRDHARGEGVWGEEPEVLDVVEGKVY